MYLLFQQQTTIERAAEDNMWGPLSKENPSHLASWSLLRMFGPTTALVVPDSRAGQFHMSNAWGSAFSHVDKAV